MQNDKIIFVTGATGKQGSAAVESLINNGFTVKALTRNAGSTAAQKLKTLGAQIVRGNLDDTASYGNELKDVHGIFCVLTFENGVDREIKQGIAMADLAKEYGINHFLYSSVIGSDINTGIPHWDSKFIIENHIKQIGLAYTIIRPCSLLENLLIPQVKSRLLKGTLSSPVNKNVRQQFIACKDVGEISAAIFLDPSKYIGKTFNIAAEEMDMQQMAETFSAVTGKHVKFQKLPMLITRLVMGKNLYKMFKWINENDSLFVKDLPAFRTEYPNLTTTKEWIKNNFPAATSA